MEAKEMKITPVRLDVLSPEGTVLQSAEFVKEKIVLGRILSADLRIDDARVSRIHALLEVRPDVLLITDLASSHGTFVNGKKIVEQKIKFGDRLRLGFVDIRIEKGSGIATQAQVFAGDLPGSEGEETLVNIDRAMMEQTDRRESMDRRKRDAFPEERRLEDRRQGDRRVDERKGDRRKQADGKPQLPEGVSEDRRSGEDRRKEMEFERRVGERRQGDRRVFDITSLERRIEERRSRHSDDDVLPQELEAAFDAPEHARELEVTALWGDHILDVSNYADPVVLNVGESPRNEYIIPSVGIPDEFPLVTIEDDGNAYLAFTEGMAGTVRAREKIYELKELKNEKFIKRFAEYYVLPLKQDDFAKLSIGNINFFVLYVKPAPRIKMAPFFDRDPVVIRTFIGSALFLLLFLITMSFIPKPKPVTIEMIPERFARVIIRERPTIPPAGLISKTEEGKQGGSVEGEGGPAIGPEGKAGSPKLPPSDKLTQTILPKSKSEKPVAPVPPKGTQQAAPDKRKLVDSNRAKSVGLLKAFSSSGVQKELKNIINSPDGPAGLGGFDDFGKAIKGGRGNTIDEAGGAGGMGVKGVEGGGGGTTIGIDGPSTKGLGRGYKGTGIGEGIGGPGRFGVKGEHAISIATENVQVLSGLPKDVINAVVQKYRSQIRFCYDAALQRSPGLRGKVVVAFTIQPNGTVSYAGIKDSTIGDSGLEGCMTSKIRTWKFPQPEAPVVTEVSAYPFILNPAN